MADQAAKGEALNGVDVVWRYRQTSKEGTEKAWGLAFTTENGYSKSKDSDSTPTKSGSVVTPGQVETTGNATTYYMIGDPRIDEMEDAMDKNYRMGFWRINTKEKGTADNADKYKAIYFEGYLTSFEETDTSEDKVEYSMEFALEGTGVRGYATLDFDPDSPDDTGSYDFKDTVIITSEG